MDMPAVRVYRKFKVSLPRANYSFSAESVNAVVSDKRNLPPGQRDLLQGTVEMLRVKVRISEQVLRPYEKLASTKSTWTLG